MTMTTKQRHAKITEGVMQIGRLIEVCAKNGLTVEDVQVMMQTSASLFCEMNQTNISTYMKLFFVLHRKRQDANYDGTDVNAELAALFSLKETQH